MREGSGNRTSEGRDRARGDCESTPGRETPRQREQRREIELHRAPRRERRQTSADGSPLERPISENDSPTLPGQRRASSWKPWTAVHARARRATPLRWPGGFPITAPTNFGNARLASIRLVHFQPLHKLESLVYTTRGAFSSQRVESADLRPHPGNSRTERE